MLVIIFFLVVLNAIAIGFVGSLAIYRNEDEVAHWSEFDARRAADAIRDRAV